LVPAFICHLLFNAVLKPIPKSIASIITTCPTHSLKKAMLREGGSHREGVGGSGVMLNQSYKIWLGPRTMVRSQQSHIPTKLY
jgi:hypothetical protein